MDMPTSKLVQLEPAVEVASPCNGICTLDINNICRGCGRTRDEISKWYILSGSEKKQIVDKLKILRSCLDCWGFPVKLDSEVTVDAHFEN